MITVGKGLSRRAPKQRPLDVGSGRGTPPPTTLDDVAEHIQLVEEELQNRTTDIANKASDKTDEIEFESLGEDEEVLLVNSLKFTPNRATPCKQPYPSGS